MKELNTGLMSILGVWTLSVIGMVSLMMIYAPTILFLPRVGVALIITTVLWGILVFWRGVINDRERFKLNKYDKKHLLSQLTFDRIREKIGADEVDDFNLARVLVDVRKTVRAIDNEG